MKKRQTASLLLTFLLTLTSTSLLRAGQIWMETTYFVPDFKADLKIPVPEASWKVFTKKRIFVGRDAEGVEYLEGADQGTSSWVLGNMVVSIVVSP